MTPNEIKDGWYWCKAPWGWEVVRITSMPFRKKMQRMVLALVWKDTLDNFLKCNTQLIRIQEPDERVLHNCLASQLSKTTTPGGHYD